MRSSFPAGFGAVQSFFKMVTMLPINYHNESSVVPSDSRFQPQSRGPTGGLGQGQHMPSWAQLVPSLCFTGPSYNGFQGKRNFLACLIPIRRKQLASTRARKQNAGRAISSCQCRELLGGCRERSEVVAGVPSRTR